MSEVSYVTQICGQPYLAIEGLMETFELSRRAVSQRITEMEKEITIGTYSDYAVIRDGGVVRVSVLAFIHYMTHRQQILNGARKYVPQFNALQVARECGWHTIFHEL